MELDQTLTFSGIVAISTVVYAILISRLDKETKATRLLLTTPDVQVYFRKC